MTVQLWDGVPLIVGGAVAVHSDCCCEDQCNGCTGKVPATLEVTFEDFADGTTQASCDDCDEIFNFTENGNKVFVCDLVEISPGICHWKYVGEMAECC